jgi:S1-C subfamily serine protease
VPLEEARRFLDRALAAGAPASAAVPGPASPRVAHQPPPPVVTSAGVLGIRYRTQRDPGGRPIGAQVTAVRATSPAAPAPGRGGLQPGDVIQRVTAGGRTTLVRTALEFQSALVGNPPGTAVSIAFARGDRSYAWTGLLGGP